MKKVSLSAVACAAFLTGALANAADLPQRVYTKAPIVRPAYDWSGWYAGLNGGGAWGPSTGSVSLTTADLAAAMAVGQIPNLGLKPQGGFGGAQVGYNWQFTSWLLGLEADIQGAGINGNTTIFRPAVPILQGIIAPATSSAQDRISWFGTVRGRVGMTLDNVLVYGTGGLAFGGVTSSDNLTFTGFPPYMGSTNATRVGWTAGAGVEWAFGRNWSAKGEYLHIDLGSTSVALNNNPPGASYIIYSFRNQADALRVGLNYKFGAPAVAKY
jgi:outer membrane immunogenic protein